MNNQLEIVAPQAQPTVASMLHAVVEKGVTADSVGAVEKLVELYERMQAKDAEKQFAAAFNALQAEIPDIVASTVIPNRGKYERFEDVMRVVNPLLTKHGFSVSFDQQADDHRIKSICTLRHVGGHSITPGFAVRLGGRADSDTQADCKASTTAKRNALCHALNIVIRQDVFTEENDSAMEGTEYVTPEQADELERRVAETNSDRPAFLKFAGAAKFSEIRAARYDELDAHLRRKEARSR